MKRLRHRTIGLLLLAGLAATAVQASEVYQSFLAEAYPADSPGAAAILVRNGEVVHRGAVGMAELELGVPLSADHVFRLGSITKQFTAAAIMLLEERGRLSVGDEITKHLPDYPTHGHAVTIEHLLTHTSGIFNYTNIPGYMMGAEIRADVSTDELIDVFDELEMDFAPRERWSYSNSGYVLLGAIIEKVSGQSYADFVQENIFDPLEMRHSHYGGSQVIPGRAQGYAGTDGEFSNAPFLSMTQPHAGGSLLSTVDDLARWNAGLFGGDLLTPESVERMTTDYVLSDGETTGYGYGLAVGTVRGERSISHSGGIHGFSTYAAWLPESEVYVAVLSNHPQNAVGPGYVARQMLAEAIGKPFPQRNPIEIAAEKLADFVGVYRVDENSTRAVTLEDGRIYTQRTGRGRLEIFPYAEDAFFYKQSFTHLEFERDADGAVTGMLMYRNGADEAEPAEREGDPAAPVREVATVSPELYDLWAGTYQIQPGFNLVITRDGDRLISQATGQPARELHPVSATRYFLKEVEAELEFVTGDDGRAEEAVLYQGGQEIHAARTD
jgi:CubicO group peptidase (beta-lactamase class C family)